MKINIVAPFLNWTGGLHIMFEFAEGLQRQGHDVTIYFPLLPYRFADRLTTRAGLRRWVGDIMLNLRRRTHQPWFKLTVPLHMAPWIANAFVRDADAIVATAWPTAYSVRNLDKAKGAEFYLVQHHETWSGAVAAVDQSYRLPLRKIVVASWLDRLMREQFGQTTIATVTNGVDLVKFSPTDRQADQTATRTVLMQYNSLPWKGLADGFRAWDIVRQCCPQTRLVLFGLSRGKDVPADAEFHRDPSAQELRRLYGASDVFVSTSWMEGCQLTPMEAMACRCAVVATNVGGVPDYAIAGQTALVVEPHDVEGMAAAIIRLLEDDDERWRIAEAGYRHIQQYTWDRAVQRFEAALIKEVRHA